VIGNGECRRAPALHRVAALAAASIRPFGELAGMRIGLVAVGTAIVNDRSLEVSALVTTDTRYFKMFAQQRIVCF